jgi:hypothetical protein
MSPNRKKRITRTIFSLEPELKTLNSPENAITISRIRIKSIIVLIYGPHIIGILIAISNLV